MGPYYNFTMNRVSPSVHLNMSNINSSAPPEDLNQEQRRWVLKFTKNTCLDWYDCNFYNL